MKSWQMNATIAMRISVLFAAIVPLLFNPAHASDDCSPDDQVVALAARHGTIISGPLGVERLEAQNTTTIRETGKALPFGYENKAWEEMKAAMQPGDQIYHLAINDGRFHAGYYILVRNGCVIDRLMDYIT